MFFNNYYILYINFKFSGKSTVYKLCIEYSILLEFANYKYVNRVGRGGFINNQSLIQCVYDTGRNFIFFNHIQFIFHIVQANHLKSDDA